MSWGSTICGLAQIELHNAPAGRYEKQLYTRRSVPS